MESFVLYNRTLIICEILSDVKPAVLIGFPKHWPLSEHSTCSGSMPTISHIQFLILGHMYYLPLKTFARKIGQLSWFSLLQ